MTQQAERAAREDRMETCIICGWPWQAHLATDRCPYPDQPRFVGIGTLHPVEGEEVDCVAKAIREFVAEQPEDVQSLPAVQFINNRDDQLARLAIAAMSPQASAPDLHRCGYCKGLFEASAISQHLDRCNSQASTLRKCAALFRHCDENWPKRLSLQQVIEMAELCEAAITDAPAVGDGCTHALVNDGPRIPLRWGTAATEICCRCGSWRYSRSPIGPWQPAVELALSFVNHEECRPPLNPRGEAS